MYQIETPAFKAVTRSRSRLILTNQFWGTLACGLELIETDWIETFATDGTRLLYNAPFVFTLTEAELLGVLVHEVAHCADRHQVRRGHRDPLLWNVAADFRVNFDVRDCGFVLPWKGCTLDQFLATMRAPPLPLGTPKPPPRHFYDEQFRDTGVEEIYRILADLLHQQQPPEGEGDEEQEPKGAGGAGGDDDKEGPSGPSASPPDAPKGKGGTKIADGNRNAPTGTGEVPQGLPPDGVSDPGGCGGIIDAVPAHDGVGKAEHEREWTTRIKQTAAIAKTQSGTMPGYIRRMIEEMDNPREDWRRELRKFTDQSVHKDYSWERPNRRHLWRGLILPGLVSDRPAHVALIIDSSGSVYDGKPQEMFASEVQSILNDGAVDKITVIFADTRVASEPVTYEAGDLIDLEVRGGGGTSFREAMAWVGEHCEDAAAVIYFTDCKTSDWGDEPACPVLWAVVGPEERARRAATAAPFGEVLFIGD